MKIEFMTQEKDGLFSGDLEIIPRINETVKIFDTDEGLRRRFLVIDVHYYLGGTDQPEIVVIVA
jgi:hypothetical protein